MFQIDKCAKEKLEQDVHQYHELFQKNRCSSSELEELLTRAVGHSPEYQGKVDWESGSHRTGTDFDVVHGDMIEGASVKSGVWKFKESMLELSGYRLGRFEENNELRLVDVTSFLWADRSDVTIAFPEVTARVGSVLIPGYQLVYIPKESFVYPSSVEEWVVERNKQGAIAAYVWEAPNGLKARIHPTLSYQIWWKVPRSLCEVGDFISKRPSTVDIPEKITTTVSVAKKKAVRKPRQPKSLPKIEVSINYDLPEIPFDRDAEVSVGLRMNPSPWGPLVVESIPSPGKFKVYSLETEKSRLIVASS